MRDPVLGSDGHSYERSAITEWLAYNRASPLTRVPMDASRLVPNHALRNTIEDWVRDTGAAAAAGGAASTGTAAGGAGTAPFVDAPLQWEYAVVGAESDRKLFVRATPAGAAATAAGRQPVVLLVIVDNSGSMQDSAGGTAGADDYGFTRLDLVKHAVKTVAALLGPEDRLGIVTFSTAARVVLAPTPMDDAGRTRVDAALSTVRPDASTNIWDGIRQAATLASNPLYAGQNIAAMLLTDGVSNINPPRGILPTLRSSVFALANPWTLHAFGFGYSIDSALLAEVAEWGNGVFGFIPDASMVGTVFINAVAHILTTAVRSAELTCIVRDREAPVVVKLGPVMHGQPREWLLPYEDRVPCDATAAEATDATVVRADLVATLGVALRHAAVGTAAEATNASNALSEFYRRASPAAAAHLSVAAMLRDIRSHVEGEGQVGMAVTATHSHRWGLHYLRAYRRAQELQMCMNFKDPGLQIYGGDLFHGLQDEGDRIFCTLPPPTPSGASRLFGAGAGAGAAAAAAAPVSMSIFHNASAGCFAPDTFIRMADGTEKSIDQVCRGDTVWTPTGGAIVLAHVTCGSYKRSQPMSKVGDLNITPWHPVLVEGVWRFPADLVGYTDRLVSTVYNLVLESGHIVEANGVQAVTLAHGFKGPVIEHPFFGTDAVLRDLERAFGWYMGSPSFRNLVAIRNEAGIICGWVDRPVAESGDM